MLSAKRLPEVLRTALDDGVLGACLMTLDGSILCSVSTTSTTSASALGSSERGSSGATLQENVSETSLAAISSSVMNNYLQGNSDVSFTIIKFEHGCLAVCAAGKGYLLAAYGKNVALGLLRGRLLTLSQYFARVFEQVK